MQNKNIAVQLVTPQINNILRTMYGFGDKKEEKEKCKECKNIKN